jgi:porphobilinogen deaminase
MWQAKFIQNKLEKLHPQHIFKIQGFKTQGDIILD